MDVELHSKLKHYILAYYFGILGKFFKSFYSYYYVDPYSSDGECSCPSVPDRIALLKPDENMKKWKPPFFNLFDFAKEVSNEKNFKLTCYFNDINQGKIEKLKENLSSHSQYIGSIDSDDANQWCNKVLKIIQNPNKPGLFFLDPSNHEDLKFSTIEKISQFEGNNGRKPDLVINLMTFTMFESIKRSKKGEDFRKKEFNSITESLGTNNWEEKIEEYKGKTHELLIETFIGQLNRLGYKTKYFLIRSIGHNAPIYYLVFASTNSRAEEIFNKMEKYILTLQREKWVKAIAQVGEIRKNLVPGQKMLFEFGNKVLGLE